MKDSGLNGRYWRNSNTKRISKAIDRFKFESTKKRNYNKETDNIELDKQIKQLEYLIMKNLKYRINSSPLVKDSMELEKELKIYLEQKYKFDNTFCNGAKFLKDHKINVRRFFNQMDFCTLFKSKIEFKIAKPRKLKCFIDELL